MMLSHRTEGRDARIRSSYVPVPKAPAQIAMSRGHESALGAMMLKQALKDGHTRQVTRSKSRSSCKPMERPVDDVAPTIMQVMRQQRGELLASRIAELVSVELGRNVSPQTVRDRLGGILTDKQCVFSRPVNQRNVMWRLV